MTRLNALRDLVEFSKPLHEISQSLSHFSWDFEGEPFVIEQVHLQLVLNRFIKGDCTAIELEEWANLIECREDLEFPENADETLSAIIHQLANPALHGELTLAYCARLLESLNTD